LGSPEESNGPDELKGLIDKTGGEMIVPFANGIPTNPKEVEQFTALDEGVSSRND